MYRCTDLAGQLAAVQIGCAVAGSGQASAHDFAALLAEIKSLACCVAAARQDLSALGAADIVGYHVPAAADELDAIVAHTGAATWTILDQCERIEEATAGSAAQPAASLALARIYEACSFQDITGQRVTKVIRTLQLVEAGLQAILHVFAPGVAAGDTGADSKAVMAEPLLNGPQSTQDAMNQDAVDALLAGTP